MTALDAYATFLTARWDEAERVARELLTDQPGDYGPDCLYYNADDITLCVGARPVLADLAAKRAILAEARNYSPELSSGDNGEWAFEVVLTHLADPFRDHPDHPANQRDAPRPLGGPVTEHCPVCGAELTGIEATTAPTMLCSRPVPGLRPGQTLERYEPCGHEVVE